MATNKKNITVSDRIRFRSYFDAKRNQFKLIIYRYCTYGMIPYLPILLGSRRFLFFFKKPDKISICIPNKDQDPETTENGSDMNQKHWKTLNLNK